MNLRRSFPALGLILALLASLAPQFASAGRAAGLFVPPPPDQGAPIMTWPGQTFRFEHLGLEEGLSQSTVMAILQDKQGFLWFGTEDGLNRYDGYTFKVFRPDPDDLYSISDRWINSLYEDRDGHLWIGTQLGGLNRYDAQTGHFMHFRHDPSDPASLASNAVHALFQAPDGNLWVGTDDGLDWLDPVSGAITHVRIVTEEGVSLSGEAIQVIFGDSRGNIWIGTFDEGAILYEPSSHTFSRFGNTELSKNRLCGASVTAIAETFDGMMWVATLNGLTRVYPNTGLVVCHRNNPADSKTISSNAVEALYVDLAGDLWVGTDRGLDQYQTVSNTFLHLVHSPAISDSLSTETIYSIYEDRGGVLWVGTYGGGINKHEQTQDRFAYFRHDPDNSNSLSDNFVFPIHADKEGRVWVGTYGGGLNRFDPATGLFTRFSNNPSNPRTLPSNYIWSIFTDSKGTLWVGTSRGLSRLDASIGAFTNFLYDPANAEESGPNVVYAMAEGADGVLWLGTRDGVGRFDRVQGIFLPEAFPNLSNEDSIGRVMSLHISPAGELWFGTAENGLFRYDIKRRAIKQYRADPETAGSLGHDSVFAIYQDTQGTLWVATGGGGLNRYDSAADTFRAFTDEDGLPNNVVYGILEDDLGRLWLSTNYGVSRFDPLTQTFRNYSVSDGLGSMEFNLNAYAKAPNGAMYFGSIHGLNAFYPNQILDIAYTPPVALTSLTYEGKPLPSETTPETAASIVLRYPQNSFEFEFAALGYTATARNQYAYKLEGFDNDWYFLGNKRIGRYTNLPGGSYTLLLKAANSDGVWNEHYLSIPVTVVPPFWLTWWFRVLLGLGGVAAAVAGYRWRVRQIENRNAELEALVRARTAEIQGLFEQTKELAVIEERNRLALELHDSAKQKAFAALAQLGAAQGLSKSSPAARKHLSEAETLVAEVIQELTFLIQEMYPAALMEKGLPATVREYVFEWENRTGIQANVIIEEPRPLNLKVEQAVYRIIQESLANVARHSRARLVEIELFYRPGCLYVAIVDDGCGFDVSRKLVGLGLRSMRERVQSVGGQIIVESEPGNGTRVTAQVPLSAGPFVLQKGFHEESRLHSYR
jgi:ligand-binding sensor domain-containing protein/signal transduction histidine kinase